MERLTINELLVLIKTIRERLHDLKDLRLKVSVKESFMMQSEKIVEPQYDVIKVDKKIVELQNFLFQADSKIKQSNARTKVDIEVNVKDILSSI